MFIIHIPKNSYGSNRSNFTWLCRLILCISICWPLQSNPPQITHLCQRFLQSSKHFWYALFGMPLSSLSDSVFISSIVAKRRPFMGLFNLGNRKKSQGAKSGEYDGWGIIAVLFLGKKLRTRMTSEQVKIQQFWNELRCHTLQNQNIRKNCMA